jgi:hypothetical protein
MKHNGAKPRAARAGGAASAQFDRCCKTARASLPATALAPLGIKTPYGIVGYQTHRLSKPARADFSL